MPARSARAGVVVAAIATALPFSLPEQKPPMPGFTPEHAARQAALEARFLGVPSAATVASDVRDLTSHTHLSGTPGAARTASWLADRLRQLGFSVAVETYEPWLPLPGRVEVTVLTPGERRLSPREPRPVRDSGFIADRAPELAAWHAYSGNGRAEAEVVYGNYGLPSDYAELERLGIDVRGRIVLARLGGSYRGVKVEQAERRGAAGLLLFPDPASDGPAVGDTAPAGPYRPSWSVQRGTVAYMWRYTGDPLTPGRAALEGAERLDPPRAADLPRIPVAPISWGDAEELLRLLDGPVPPDGFRGALPVEYRPGPGPLRVRIDVEQQYAFRPVRNVIARLPGRAGQEVILGNHYDAWVLGAVDPHTGTAALLQVARGLAALAADGWRPRRTITLAFWDAEEFGVVGSTEWVEDHAMELADQAVAYFNVDMFTSGTLDVSGSPALGPLVVSAADDVEDPLTGRTLGDLWRERQAAATGRAEPPPTLPRLSRIGAGSDWTAFLYFAGVPSLQWTMNGTGVYGVYHSVLDDAEYYRQHADSSFARTPAFARVFGLAALRLAEADALPFRYTQYAARILDWIAEVERIGTVPLTPERELARSFLAAADSFERAQDDALRRGAAGALGRADAELVRVERAFLDRDGLPGRPWYRHQLFAPGSDTGYDAEPLPAVAEALLSRDDAALARARSRLSEALLRATEVMNAAHAGLRSNDRRQ